jgi:hypothetical protein
MSSHFRRRIESLEQRTPPPDDGPPRVRIVLARTVPGSVVLMTREECEEEGRIWPKRRDDRWEGRER